MKKNSRGFTLVELLVVIAIMGSILVLAIGNLNKISSNKKQESLKKIEDQVIVAAKQYFEANEYLFEALKEDINGNSVSRICLNKLVQDDYINALTDPTTNKKLDKDDYIEVAKLGKNKFKYRYKSKDGTCDTSSISTITYNENGKYDPDTEINYYDETGKKIEATENWFNIASFTVNNENSSNAEFSPISDTKTETKEEEKKIKICVKEKNSKVSLSSVNIYDMSTTETGGEYCITKSDDYNKENRNIVINYSSSSKISTKTETDSYGKDTISPTIDVLTTATVTNPANTEFKISQLSKDTKSLNIFEALKLAVDNENVYAYFYDKTSGIASKKVDDSDIENKMISVGDDHNLIVTDNAGNSSSATIKKGNYERCSITTETETIKEKGTCNCETNKVITKKTNVSYDYNDENYICESEDAGTEEEACECTNNPPSITVKIYKVDKNKLASNSNYYDNNSTTNKGTPIMIKTFTGTSSGNIINVNNGNWMNSADYPDGIYVEYISDSELTERTWYWNKKDLDENTAKSNNYAWNNTTGFANGSSTKYTDKVTKGGHPIREDGVRKTVLSAKSNGGTTKVYINAKLDRIPPKIENVTFPQRTTSYCGGKKSIYTAFKVTDAISKVYQVNHYLEDQPYYKPTAANIVDGDSFYSVHEGKADNITVKGGLYMNVFNNSTTAISNGFQIKRAWAYDTVGNARTIRCGTKADKRPNVDDPETYCNYVSAKDAAGNVRSAALCYDKTSYYNNY